MGVTTTYIIIPAFNEAEVIQQTIQSLTGKGYEIVVVDDGSADNTENRLKDCQIHYLKHRINLGQGAALQTGIEYARAHGASLIASFDADGQHDPADIESMIRKLEKDNLDIVFGSRFMHGSASNITGSRKLLLTAGRWINYFFSGILLSDSHNGIRVFNREAAGKLSLKENHMAHASEFLLVVKKEGLKFGESPVHINYTEYSKKKGQSLFNSIRIFLDLVLNKLFN